MISRVQFVMLIWILISRSLTAHTVALFSPNVTMLMSVNEVLNQGWASALDMTIVLASIRLSGTTDPFEPQPIIVSLVLIGVM